MMNCPDCGGPMWDNRETKKNPKQPDYKCKNKQCDKAVWLKPKAAAGGNGAPRSGANGSGNGNGRRPLAPLYRNCVSVAKLILAKELPNATPADILAATATLFIAASRDGTPLVAPTPKPAPPPPPPEPEPEQEYYAAEVDYENADNLPF